MLIEESYESAVQQRSITRSKLAAKIGIKLDLSPISQEFPFDEEHYIKTSRYFEALVSKFNAASGKMIGVVGLPGTGKSHLLTFWSNTVSDSGTNPIMYYCFIGHESQPDIRVTQNQLLQDLINSILTKYPDLASKEKHSLLAATPKRLNDLLSELGKYARSKNQTIPIVIDGLDHIGRIKEKYLNILYNKEDILTFLEKMEIPEGIALIVGSQPGQHLTNLQERFGADNFMEIKGFTKEESKKYLKQFGINYSDASNSIKSVIEKSNGLPLLLAYSVQANRDISLNDRLAIFKNISKELPKTKGNVKAYYDWLWKNISSNSHTCHYARLLSLIDFPASGELLESVISKSMRLGTSLDECMEPLVSVTTTTDKGVIFFHDSFGTYVRADSNFSAEDRIWYFENLFLYFKKSGIFSSNLAYAKGIDFAFKAKLYNEILNMVTLEFVDDSVMMAFPQQQILSQIDFAIRSAVNVKNIPILVRNCVLKKYTEERFEFNYPSNEITCLYIKLKKNDSLQRLIFSNNSLNTDLATTIDLLSLCMENKVDLPYKKIMETIEKTDDVPALTGDRVDYFLQIAKIYLEYGMKEKAESAFNNAILATHAYGYRKDLFMDEVHDIAIQLNMTNPSKSLERAEDILRLAKYLWGVTDHAETKWIPANVTKELIRLKTKAGLKLLQQFNKDNYDLPSIECLPFAISSMKNAPLPLRWKLVTCANYERSGAAYNDENWLMGMKFELVKQAMDEKNETLANEIMENIRDQINTEFKVCEQKWEKDFQSYAEILKIKPLDLTDKSSTDSYLVDSKRDPPHLIQDGSVKEIIEQFEKLDRKKDFDAEKDIKAIFDTKIKTMCEEELDELTEFLARDPRGIFNSTCGDLEKITCRYEGTNKEKFLNTMFLAFDTYGWIGYGYPSITKWLAKTYNVDPKKTMDFVLESFAQFSVEKYGPHGAIRRLAEFLYLTNQIKILKSLYEDLYGFCKTFFRTYTDEFDEFRWLRGTKFETVDDEQIIQELIKMAQT